jgi:phospholipid/cholesterol/gamma-HCH transport system substrate-binding protein
MEKTTSQKNKIRPFLYNWAINFHLATYLIGDKQNVWKTSDLEAVFTNVNGLQLGNNVRYSGVNVELFAALK